MNKTSTPSKKIKSSSVDSASEFSNEEMFAPRAHVIQNILNYSKSLQVKESKSVGQIEIVQS